VPVSGPGGTVSGMTQASRDDADGILDAAEQDPTEQENSGAGPARTDAPESEHGDDASYLDDVRDAPAGPAATPADPDQPLNPA
jgi:hypothetical protein